MKITVLGGTGFIGTRIVEALRESGTEVVVGSRSTGVDAMTGQGLDQAVSGSTTLIDVTNAPSYDEADIRTFFDTAMKNICAAAVKHRVQHYLLLSIVGVDRMADSPYMLGKLMQERIVSQTGVPFTILRATQFFEFLEQFAGYFEDNGTIRLPQVRNQALAADDVVQHVARLICQDAQDKVVELAGPEQFQLVDMVRNIMKTQNDVRPVVEDPEARYFGSNIDETALVPSGNHLSGTTKFSEWLN